jgi:ubiquinone/menaquinone biosynthesis C-methylase UbiE
MSYPMEPRQEQPSTSFVSDHRSPVELVRLQLQDRMLTASMGGVWPEQADPTRFLRVLDVGCGTGGWLLDVAKAFPQTTLLIGVDLNRRWIEHASEQAEADGLSHRVQFRLMDALGRLLFPDQSFDLVNQRFGASFVRQWDWPRLLQEYRRVSKPGGVIRLTEFDVGDQSSSPALLRLSELLVQALFQAGHFFRRAPNGLTGELARLLQEQGISRVQTHAYTIEYRAGTVQADLFREDIRHLYRTILPFLQKWTRVPTDYEAVYEQMLAEMQQPDACGRHEPAHCLGRKSGVGQASLAIRPLRLTWLRKGKYR